MWPLSCLLPGFKAVGIAWSAVGAQVYALLAFTFVLRRAGLNPFALAATAPARAPSVSDLAAVSGLDHQEVPVEFLVSEPESVVQKPFVENGGSYS